MRSEWIACCLLCASAAAAQITTKSYDNARTSENRGETILTPAKVAQGMKMLPRIPCIGDARGCEAQPLIDGNVMILASEANVIRGVAPDGGAAIWQTEQLCVPVNSQPSVDMWRINQHVGIMGTPVIDGDTHKAYVIATCSEDGSGSPASMRQRWFVLDDRTGAVLANTLIDGTDGNQRMSSAPRKQRSAQALWNINGVKMVVALFGSFSETANGSEGWVVVLDTFDNTVKTTRATSQGRGAGAWMSSQGAVIDKLGRIYFGTGNGAYNAVTDFGEALIQMGLTPPTATTPARLSYLSSFARFSDSGRTGGNPQLSSPTVKLPNKLAGDNAATNPTDVVGAKMLMAAAGQEVDNAAYSDQDDILSITLVDGDELCGAGKDGIAVCVDTTNFPRTQPADFANPKANCAKAIGIYQFGHNLGIDSCPTDMTKLNLTGKTWHIHGPMAQLHLQNATYLVMGGENGALQAWRKNADRTWTYVARSGEIASADLANTANGGMPGWFPSVSSNNGANTIIWAAAPDGDANRTVSTGHIYAYDAAKFVAGQPAFIWKSDTLTFGKFSQPIVHNGVLIYNDYAGAVDEWVPAQ